jgi:hypothetical protein
MNDTIRNKHVLGALTLRDLEETIEKLRLWSVEIDGELYERFSFYADTIKIWKGEQNYIDDLPADLGYELDSSVKVKDGKVVAIDPVTDVETTFLFGKIAFVPTKIEIL